MSAIQQLLMSFSNKTPKQKIFPNYLLGEVSWVVPANVTSICVVAIGGGCAGMNGASGEGNSGDGGKGGDLVYSNNIAVTPGETLTIRAGNPGIASGGLGGSAGSSSYIKRGTTILVSALGGAFGYAGSSVITAGTGAIGAGGDGGYGNSDGQYGFSGGGGGGAGGYGSSGGGGGTQSIGSGAPGFVSVGSNSNATGGNGGGGGGGYPGEKGGGTYPFGQGSSGGINADGSWQAYNPYGIQFTYGPPGFGGRGGGNYNGSGGSPGYGQGQSGGTGFVRIIWGAGRSFPSTRTLDEFE